VRNCYKSVFVGSIRATNRKITTKMLSLKSSRMS